MMLPLNFRVISVVCVVVMISAVLTILLNSKEKHQYDHLKGKVIYIDKTFGDLPNRDFEKYRYLKLDNYPYAFEIYVDEQANRFDRLKVGDLISVYFYETDNTRSEEINRFLQFLDRGGESIFIRTSFAQATGYTLFAMCAILIIICYVLYKNGKLRY